MKLIEQRTSACLPDLGPGLSRVAANLAFDVIERTDTLDRFGSDRSSVGSFDDPSAFVEMMKTRIAIGLKDAGEACDVLLRTLAFTIFRVANHTAGGVSSAAGRSSRT
jgi:hypothetical protein